MEDLEVKRCTIMLLMARSEGPVGLCNALACGPESIIGRCIASIELMLTGSESMQPWSLI